MPFISPDLDAFLLASLTITIPFIWHLSRWTSIPTSPPLRRPLGFLVFLHTLYILHRILVKRPLNVFSSLDIPLTTPTDKIRAALIARAGGDKLPEKIQDLLTKLGSFEIRTFYVRYARQRPHARILFLLINKCLRIDLGMMWSWIVHTATRFSNMLRLLYQRLSYSTFARRALLDCSPLEEAIESGAEDGPLLA